MENMMKQGLIHITENIFLWPHHPDPRRVQPSIGIIVGEQETILVDAGNSPTIANQLKKALKARGLPDVSSIIYTHNHWDHVSGACAFDVPVTAHVLCRSILLEEAKKPWGPEYIRQEIIRTPKRRTSLKARDRAIRDWDTFRMIIPNDIFETTKTIPLDHTTLELVHVGGAHSADSIIIKIPEAKVMFLGDCYFPPPLHLRRPGETFSMSMLQSFVQEHYSIYIDSHNDPSTRQGLLNFLEENA
jgi:glyoxylase-like metal-dependent hydrolase (beta-lactamase superfamily II)